MQYCVVKFVKKMFCSE